MGLTKATLTNLNNHHKITVLFNPTEYTIAKTNTWASKPNVGKNVPKRDFTGGNSRKLDIELFLDVLETRGAGAGDHLGLDTHADVRKHVDELVALTLIDQAKKNPKTKKARPPLCLFQWGGQWSFQAAVTSLSVRYTLFREDGTPVRATAKISLEEAEDELEQKGTNPTSYAEPGRKRREVRPFDTLPLIAYEEYGDPALWRRIAEDNHMDDPFALKAGQVLSIPN